MVCRLLTLLAGLVLTAGCVPKAQPMPAAPAASGVVSAADERATQAGIEMLRAGGSATDAALAVMLALTIVEPQSSGIGGGSFLIVHTASGQLETIDGRETAPASARSDRFLRDGQPMAFKTAVPGGLSVGIPGNIGLMAEAHRRHGKLPWAQLFGPAIRLARDGFTVTERLHQSLRLFRDAAALTERGRALYFQPSGEPVPVGTTITLPALAALLERIAAEGPSAFYTGPNAAALADAVSRSPINPATITPADLAAYRPVVRAPVCGTYRQHRVCGMAAPSSGGIAVIQILKQLERFDLGVLGPNSPTSWHLFAESTRLAFADRNQYLADPDFVAVPQAGLIAPDYLTARSLLISPDRAMTSAPAGLPRGAPVLAAMAEAVDQGTSHVSVTDRHGEAVSLTSTVENGFGSGLIVNDYFLNNELTDFSFAPVAEGRSVANAVAPGKRPRSSMAPMIVYGPDGAVRLVIGAAGGSTIIAQVAKAIIAVIDWKLSAEAAIAMPLLQKPGDTVHIEPGSRLEAMVPALRALGHDKFATPTVRLKGNAVERVGGRWVGAADPRSEGKALVQ